MRRVKKPPLLREWYRCSACGKKIAIYDNTAACSGVFIKCKNCGKEEEILIAPK